jgi:hypothetical protein
MNRHADTLGAGTVEAPRGASGREIALRFNRALLLASVMTIVVIWLLPV